MAEPRGLEDFAGTVMEGFDEVLGRLDELDGQRVALLGDSGLVTRAARRVSRPAALLKVFQRDPVWVLPHVAPGAPLLAAARTVVPRLVYRRVTDVVATRHLRHQISDGWTRRQLTPSNRPTRANVVYSNGYYRALRRDDVELIAWPIAGVVASGIRTADGIEHHVDIIVIV